MNRPNLPGSANKALPGQGRATNQQDTMHTDNELIQYANFLTTRGVQTQIHPLQMNPEMLKALAISCGYHGGKPEQKKKKFVQTAQQTPPKDSIYRVWLVLAVWCLLAGLLSIPVLAYRHGFAPEAIAALSFFGTVIILGIIKK